MENVKKIIEKLNSLNNLYSKKNLIYLIPELWIRNFSPEESTKFTLPNPFLDKNLKIKNGQNGQNQSTLDLSSVVNVNPFLYFKFVLENILFFSGTQKEYQQHRVYNIFNRLLTAFDHNNSGTLLNSSNFLDKEITREEKTIKGKVKKNTPHNSQYIEFVTPDGGTITYQYAEFNKLGTFLKTTALLFYIKSLDISILHFLPIFENGTFGKKGTLGSPYAVKNFFNFDINQTEKILCLDPETEFLALVECAKKLNFKIVLEFPLRITSLDNDWALENPEWFYWIKANTKYRELGDLSESKYGSPIFLKRELKEIKEKIEKGDFSDLVPPHEVYQNLFTKTPKKVARVEGKILGLYENNKECTIASAFADYPPDDNQPAWEDVAYLKLYEHPNFNYVAYNTVRMYDTILAKQEYQVKPLWNKLTSIIPYYIKKYDIDGAMIDMGHALPFNLREEIIQKARAEKQNFLFWEENFAITKNSKNEGYNSTLGYFFLDAHINYKVQQIVQQSCNNEFEQDFFLTPENHNTKRITSYFSENQELSLLYPKLIYTLSQFLPQTQYLHNGFELAETQPINTGLGFTDEEIQKYSQYNLALFNPVALNWTAVQHFKGNGEPHSYELLKNSSVIDFILFINRLLEVEHLISPDKTATIIGRYSSNEYFIDNRSIIQVENLIQKNDTNKLLKLVFFGNFSSENRELFINCSQLLRYANPTTTAENYNERTNFSNVTTLFGDITELNTSKSEVCINLQAFEFIILKLE